MCRIVKETAGWTHKKDTLESEKAALTRLEVDAAELASSDMAAKPAAAQQVLCQLQSCGLRSSQLQTKPFAGLPGSYDA